MIKYIFGGTPKPSDTKYEFKLISSYDERKKESTAILNIYPNMVPIIIEKSDRSEIQDIDKHKYLFKKNAKFGNVMVVVRKRLKLKSDQNIFFFINNKIIPKVTDKIGYLYNLHKDKDFFLYLTYA